MLFRLEVECFGKFRRRQFSFKQFNFIFGKNESGKTTFFDLLADQLLEKGNNQFRNYLRHRYGQERKVRLFTDENNLPQFEAGVFFNVVAAGSLKNFNLEMNFHDDWIGTLKNRVFSGGIDGGRLLQNLQKYANDRDIRLKHNQERAQIKKNIESLKSEIEAIECTISDAQKSALAIAKIEEKLAELYQEIERNRADLEAVENQLQQQEFYQRFEQIEQEKEELLEAENIFRQIAGLDKFRQEKQEEIEHFEQSRRDIERKKIQLSEKKNILLAKIKATEEQCLQNNNLLKKKIELFNYLKEKLKLFKTGKLQQLISWKEAAVLFVGTIFGAVAFFLQKVLLFPPAFLILFFFFFSLFRKKRQRKAFFCELNQTLEVEQSPRIKKVENFNALELFCEQLFEEIDLQSESLQKLEAQITEDNKSLLEIEKNLTELKQQEQEINSAVLNFFNEYRIERFQDYEVKRKILQEKEQQLKRFQSKFGFGSESELQKKFSSLQKEQEHLLTRLTTTKLTAEEVVALKNKRDLLQKRREELQKIELELSREQNILLGKRDSLSEQLLNRYNELLFRREELQTKKQELEDELRAAGVAAELVAEVVEEQQNDFSFLIERVQPLWAEFLEQSRIAFNKFSPSDIVVTDRSGVLRPLPFLSRSTADGFYFCLRLVLAENLLKPEQRLLLLDDSFLTFDSERKRVALKLLKDFCGSKNIQLFYFSCDDFLRAQLEESSNLKIVDLD